MGAMIRTTLLAAALLTGCAATSAQTPHEGPVKLGQTAYVGGPKVRPIRVIEDSRCPANVRCVWAGRVILRVAVTLGSGTRDMDLTLGKPALVADGTLELVSVTPKKSADVKQTPADYRFTFKFSGGL